MLRSGRLTHCHSSKGEGEVFGGCDRFCGWTVSAGRSIARDLLWHRSRFSGSHMFLCQGRKEGANILQGFRNVLSLAKPSGRCRPRQITAGGGTGSFDV